MFQLPIKVQKFLGNIGYSHYFALLLLPQIILAMPSELASQESESRQAGIYFANDAQLLTLGLLSDEDRYFSQGVHVFWMNAPHTVQASWKPIHWIGEKLNAENTASSFRFGQDIFTPNDLSMSSSPILDDRPFLGWTHLDLAQRFYGQLGIKATRLILQMDIGLVGPLSFGKDVQVWYHEKRRATSTHPELDPDPSKGWDRQYGKNGFPSRFQVITNYGIDILNRKYGNIFGINLGAETFINVGTLYGILGLIAQSRLGLMTRDFYQPQIDGNYNGWEGFIFTRTEVNAVGWNKVLTGEPSSEVKIAPLLLKHELGILFRGPSPIPELSFSLSFWSRETLNNPREPFQLEHTDYRPYLQVRGPWFDHGFGTVRLVWLW